MEKRSLASLWGRQLLVLAFLSLVMSLIALSQPLYMLNLYDRVLSSQSVDTLVSLTVITLFVLACFGGFDWARSQVQMQMGRSIEEQVRPTLMDVSIRLAAIGKDVRQRLARLDELKGFVTSQAFVSLFDLIFVPVYFLALFLFHTYIGLVCSVIALMTVIVALIPESLMKQPLAENWMRRHKLRREESVLVRNAAELAALGAVQPALEKHLRQQSQTEDKIEATQRSLNRIQSINKVSTMIIQTVILGTACYLVIAREISTGVMFAVNIVAMRALGPLFQVTSSFKSLNRAREAWDEISDSLRRYKKDERAIQRIHAPNLKIRSLTILDRVQDRKVLTNIHMDVDPGELVVVTGSSGAGKSTLLRAAVGLLPDYVGTIELDNREIKHWRFDREHGHIGYLPQDVRLFNATIAENIAMYEEGAKMEDIVALCRELDLHDDIAALKDGYETVVDAEAPQFSGGQLRLLGLVRACYGSPSLLVLDEPTTGLDFEKAARVAQFLKKRQAEGTALLVTTHSAQLLRMATKVMWLKWGMVKSYGLRDEVLAKMGAKEAA